MATRSARGIVIGHALKHRDTKSGTNGPTTVRAKVSDISTGAQTTIELAMDDSQARTDYPIGSHLEVTIERVQGELNDAAATPAKGKGSRRRRGEQGPRLC